MRTALKFAVILAFTVGAGTLLAQAGAPAAPLAQWWVAKGPPGQYGGNKPHIPLSALKARHTGQATWNETVVNDDNFHAEYNQAPPGTRISSRFHPDTREFWVVVDGEVHFTITGQAPIVATRGSVVQVPRKTIYSMEVAGDRPALWVDVNQQNFKTMYTGDMPAPPAMPGAAWIKVAFNLVPAPYTATNVPHFNLHEAEKDPKFAGRTGVIADDHMWANALWGYEKNLPAYDPDDKGHFHVGTAEWWVILEGSIRHNIETIGDFTSNEGDIVYAPSSTWHATRFAGPGPSCRLAISGFEFTSLLELPKK